MKKVFIICTCLAVTTLSLQRAGAQSLKSISKVVSSVAGHFSSLDLTGRWEYTGSSVAFESDNLLKKAGGEVAASKIEDNIDSQLSKVGFEPGVTSFVFNDDGTFSNSLGGRTLTGTYSYDTDTGYLTLKYLNHLPMKAKLTGNSSRISLLFESGGFLSMVTFLGSHSGVGVLKGLSPIAGSYDGMMVGLELKKQ